jgi:hypothetical protein
MTLAAKGKLFTTCELTAAIYANPKWAGCTTGFAWRLLHLRIALAAPMLEGAPGKGAPQMKRLVEQELFEMERLTG